MSSYDISFDASFELADIVYLLSIGRRAWTSTRRGDGGVISDDASTFR